MYDETAPPVYFWIYWALANVTAKHVLADHFACYSTTIYCVFPVNLVRRSPETMRLT